MVKIRRASIAAVMACATVAGLVRAQDDPVGCTGPGVSVGAELLASDQVTPLANPVNPGDVVYVRVTLSKSAPTACAFGGGTLSLLWSGGPLDLPFSIPCIGGGGADPVLCDPALDTFVTPPFPHVVTLFDFFVGAKLGVGYRSGTAYTCGQPTTDIQASALVDLGFLPTCDDSDWCTAEYYDWSGGIPLCRHRPDPRCSLAGSMSVKLAGMGGTALYKRSGGSKDGVDFVKVALKESVLTSENDVAVRRKVKVTVVLTGADAAVASLLYPVVALQHGTDALTVLQDAGYDFAASGTVQRCDQQMPAAQCARLAEQFIRGVSAELVLGDTTERAEFERGLAVLGYRTGSSCDPTTCMAAGATCGAVPDGCGGTLDCGTCTLPLSCGGGGIPNQCGIIF